MHTKTQRFTVLFVIVAALLALTAGMSLAKDSPFNLLAPQAAIGTGFTYQGQLTDGGSPAAGTFDFQFDLYDADAGGTLLGTVTLEDVAVTDGLFTVTLDFGAGAFDGDARWLAIGVRPGGETGAFTALTPRQALTAAPYAQYAVEAGSVAWDGLTQNPIPGACAAGQIMAWDDALSVWACTENTGTTYNAGFGLGLDNTTFNVLTDTVQTRVTGTCAAGSMVTAVNADGTVVCETDDDTTYAAGTALELDGTTFNVLTDTVQTRVTGTCAPGSMVTAVNADGTVVCETDDDTTYAAGTALELDGTTFNVLTDTVQTRVTGTCAAGSMVTAVNADGTVICETDDDTTYTAGTALELDGTTFNVLTDTVQTRVTGTCAAGSMVTAVNADGTVICETDDDTTYTAGTALELDGTTFNVLTDTVQTRVTGECTVGSTIQTINADGTAVCEPHDTRPVFSRTTLDTAGWVGLSTSITVGADGLPIISYQDSSNYNLKVAHCNDAACTSATITAVDTTGDVGGDTSITIGADGLPIISYYDNTNDDLKAAHCNDIACTSATITTLDTAGTVGRLTSITIGADGLPIISYYGGGNLKAAHCNNAACTSATATALDTAGDVGWYTAITIGTDGLPIISYWDFTNGDLKVVHCSNTFCVPFFRRR